MHLEARTFSIEFAKDYEYRLQFLQIIEDKSLQIFLTRGTDVMHVSRFTSHFPSQKMVVSINRKLINQL